MAQDAGLAGLTSAAVVRLLSALGLCRENTVLMALVAPSASGQSKLSEGCINTPIVFIFLDFFLRVLF